MFKKLSITLIAVLLAAGLFTGETSAKQLASGKSGVEFHPNHRLLIGQIQEIGASDFKVEGLNGETHIIIVTDETDFRIRTGDEPAEASFSDLAIGMYVGVNNHKDSSGVSSARLVVILPEDFDPSQLKVIRVTGEINMATSGGGFFKIETRKGETLTFTVDENTRYGGGIESFTDLE